MITFGMMALNPQSELDYFTEISRRANPGLMKCYRFSPSHIHPVSQLASGERFDHGKDDWVKDEFPVPKILYDRCFYSDDPTSKQSKAIVQWLKSRGDLIFLGNGLPNKWTIYEKLSKSSLSPYLPETFRAHSGQAVILKLKEWRKVILKPILGSGGAGIYSVEQKKQTYLISMDSGEKLIEKRFHSEGETKAWIDELFQKKDYLMQRYLELKDHENHPFDIRFLLQKNQEGKWCLRGKGIRRGHKAGILSNLSAGGKVLPFDEYIRTLDQKAQKFFLLELKEIISQLPLELESSFPHLFELGIDIGISADKAIWILDTNSKPGRKVMYATAPHNKEELYRAPIDYALFLASNLSEREEQRHEKTISD